MSTIVKYRSTTPLLLSQFPGSIKLKKALSGKCIGVISAELYKPTYKVHFVGGKVVVSTGPVEPDIAEFFRRYSEKDLMTIPQKLSVSINNRYQVIGIDRVGVDTTLDNFISWEKLVPFPSVPFEIIKNDKPTRLLEYLVALPSAQWNVGRVAVLSESSGMIHLGGPSIAPMVFQSLSLEYIQLLKGVKDNGFEALLYFAVSKCLPSVAEKLVGTPRLTPSTYEKHIKTWL